MPGGDQAGNQVIHVNAVDPGVTIANQNVVATLEDAPQRAAGSVDPRDPANSRRRLMLPTRPEHRTLRLQPRRRAFTLRPRQSRLVHPAAVATAVNRGAAGVDEAFQRRPGRRLDNVRERVGTTGHRRHQVEHDAGSEPIDSQQRVAVAQIAHQRSDPRRFQNRDPLRAAGRAHRLESQLGQAPAEAQTRVATAHDQRRIQRGSRPV